MKVLIRVSKGINKDYFDDIEKVINSIKTEGKIKKEIEFFFEDYKFNIDEGNQILNNPNAFLDEKIDELSESQKSINSIIYIPDMTLNLKENFLWYSLGDPQHSVMVFSSFLYKYLIEGKLNFGAYILLIYSQYLARFTVKLEKSHRESRNCLNDFCANQIEILNAFENEKDVLCHECLENKQNDEYYHIIYSLVNHINKKFYQKKIKIVKPKQVKPKKKIQEIKQKMEIKTEPSDYLYYEYEIYMAKKCANISKLYEELNQLLPNPNSAIKGYSIYEVGGGWRGEINLPESENGKWEKLKSIQSDFEEKGVKDLIRPIFNNDDKKHAVFDETSIILRIVVKEKRDVPPLDPSASRVYREIQNIFEKISDKENSIFFTLKRLEYGDTMEKKD